MAFEGYTPETVDFLWGIRMNNNREWFLSHKKDYVKHLYEPTKALGAHIFEPFYRVDKNFSREQGSSGLGLSICQKIAQEHQAHIEVESTPEGPTIFTVWFTQEEVTEDEM